MQLSIIILNYKVPFFLEMCLISVQKAIQNLDAEIIVVDNCSQDNSCEMVKTKFPNIQLIENTTNFGFPKGNNIGVSQAKGKYICILNPDTVVSEDTFEKILKFLLTPPSVIGELGIIGCKLIDGSGNFLPESKRGVPTPWVAVTKIFGFYKISNFFGKYYAQHLTENQSGKVDVLVGAFMFLERELYIKMGGFDENCFMYSDDIDLSYSILKLGYNNYYFADTTVIHYKGESTIRDAKYMKRFQEAMQFFYKKHFTKSVVFDFMMKIGSFMFSLFKKNQQKNIEFKIDEYIFFTKTNTKLNLEKNIYYRSDFKEFTNKKHSNYEIIFDINSFTFKEIISFMETYKSTNITFKNYIPDSNFIIGSNSANDLGKVIKIKI
jgi:GT2 family glycosyltransferase